MDDSQKKVLPSVCALDCPDACAIRLTIDRGKVVKLQGDPNHPITQGFACVKMARYPERQEHPDRLLFPMKRSGRKGSGSFERISWDQALDEISGRLKKILDDSGPQGILPYCYAGTMGKIEGNQPLAFFRALGALELDQTICAATGGAAWEANYGPNKLSVDPEDVCNAQTIILWGINVLRSNSHLAPWLKEARKRGAMILHIDPYRNETSQFADEHWQIRVGTDAALALAIGNEIFQQGWVDQTYLDQFASGLEEYRQEAARWPLERAAEFCALPVDPLRRWTQRFACFPPSFLKVGYGMTRNEGGGNAVRAVTLLPVLIGAWKHRGGGGALSTSGAFPLNMSHCGGLHLRRDGVRHVNMNCLGSELDRKEDPLRALFVFNSNPAAVAPNSSLVRAGLEREDLFTVVLEHFQTDTADYADYLLPATTFLEHPDLYTSYGHYYLQWAEAIVPAQGESRPNSWFFSQLAKRLGLDDPVFSWSSHELAQSMLQTDHPWMAGITWERLQRERSIKLNLPEPFLPYSEGSHFEDRKIRFSPPPQQLVFQEQLNADYPLRLISPPGPFIINTSLGNLESLRRLSGGQPRVLIHPADAASARITDQAMIRIRSRYGSIIRQAVVTTEAAPQTLVALGQWWPKLAPDRKSLNDLTSELLTDLGGGSTFGNPAVVCEPLEEPLAIHC